MKLEPELFEKLTPFTVYGFDMFSAGKSSFKTGAMIGIPSNLYYKTPKDIDKKNIMVLGSTIHNTYFFIYLFIHLFISFHYF